MEIKQDNTRVFVPSSEGTPMTINYAEELFSTLPKRSKPSLADIEEQRLRRSMLPPTVKADMEEQRLRRSMLPEIPVLYRRVKPNAKFLYSVNEDLPPTELE